MSTHNPYVAPRAAVDDAPEDYQPVRIFSVSGRIGRARYIAYTLGISLLLGIAGGVLSAALGEAAVFVAYGAIFLVSLMLTIQRSHDFNTTGWLAILGLVPLRADRRVDRSGNHHRGHPGRNSDPGLRRLHQGLALREDSLAV